MADNSFKLLCVLVTCKNEDHPLKNEGARVVSHCNSMQIFMTLKGSSLHSLRLVLLAIQTHPSFYGCPCYLKE